MRTIDYIVIHTAGAYDWKRKMVVHQSVDAIRRYHIEHNGWRDIGYHRYIECDGTIMHGRHDFQTGAHVGGFNANTLSVCVSGHGDFESFNDEQTQALILQCVRWCRDYRLPAHHVIGHRETDEAGGPPVHKTCPGKLVDMDVIRELVRERLETSG